MRRLPVILAVGLLLAGCVQSAPEPSAPRSTTRPATSPAPTAPTKAAPAPALRFPPPEFTDHALPQTQQPPPKAAPYEYVDLAVLAAALAAASYLALKRRSRNGMVLLTLFSLGYFGFYREGCICPVGSVQNVALAACDASYAIPIFAAAIFLLPLITSLFFGRAFCGGVCPLGAIQDLVLIRPVKVPDWLAGALRLGAYAYLGAAVLLAATGAGFVICRYDPFVSIFRLSGSLDMVLLGASVLAIGLFVGRPYCRFLCPYGVLLGWLSRVSKWRVRITPTRCIRCRLCEDACPFGAIRKPNADEVAPRRRGRGALAAVLAMLPVLVAAGAVGGYFFGPVLSRAHHTVRLADLIRAERSGQAGEAPADPAARKQQEDMKLAFEVAGGAQKELYAQAEALDSKFTRGGLLFGAFLGLAVGGMLLRLSVRRTRTDYEADKSACLACGRCFAYCPVHRNPQAALREDEVIR